MEALLWRQKRCARENKKKKISKPTGLYSLWFQLGKLMKLGTFFLVCLHVLSNPYLSHALFAQLYVPL